ncbi:probable WRKY transcription factor 4 [Trifolium pratense]|uniref:probable WRKY transcription factor 4 n=1 Tax=Trifolium pratense TaxID=57577 RepID=UPI001E6969BA|nr:probable WRKY transcription factor 4 [Trifolium pratense]
MDNDDWDLSSIVRSCKATIFSDPSTICETPPQNLTTTVTPTTNFIVSPINTTTSCFGEFIFNQEISSVENTYTADNDWDLYSIVRSCKAATFTNSSTFCETPAQNLTTSVTTTTANSRASPINTTPCFADFTFNKENSFVSFTPLKPNDFLDLNKLRVDFNSITNIRTPTTTSIPITVTTTTSSLTTTGLSTHIAPNIITNTNTGVQVSNQNSTFFDFSTPIKQYPMQPNEFSEKYNFITKFNPTTSIPTPETTMSTSAISTPITTNHTTIIPITTTTTFTNPTTTISTHTTTPTHPQQPKPQSRIRSYYKCSSSNNCPARKHVEKSETEENTYVVTYRGKHNHRKPEVKQNSDNETSRNKPLEARLPVVGQAGSSQNFENLGSPHVAMVQFDQSESNNSQVLDGHSKLTNPKTKLIESQSHVIGEVGSSHNVQKVDSNNRMMLQRDEPERSNAPISSGELEIPYFETNFIGSYNDDDDILIPNMSIMSEDFLLDFNHLNGSSVLP